MPLAAPVSSATRRLEISSAMCCSHSYNGSYLCRLGDLATQALSQFSDLFYHLMSRGDSAIEIRIIFCTHTYMIAVEDRRRQDRFLLRSHNADIENAVRRHQAAPVEIFLQSRGRPRAARPAKEERGKIWRGQQALIDQVLHIPDRSSMPDLQFRLDIILVTEAHILGQFLARVQDMYIQIDESFVMVADNHRNHISLLFPDFHAF